MNRRSPTLILKRWLFVTLLAVACVLKASAQGSETGYTQYMNVLTPINHAYSLVDKAGSVDFLTRKQLVGIDGAPTSILFNLNMPLASIDGSAGLSISNEQIAIERQTEINAYIAKSIQLTSDSRLGVALNAGIRSYAANYSTLDADDPEFKQDVRQTQPNIGFGVIYYTNNYYVGVSLPELTINTLGTASAQPSVNFKNNYYLMVAYITEAGDDIKFKPAALIALAKGATVLANVSGTFYIKDELGLGLNYRTDKQAAGIISFTFDQFRLGYSYQFGTTSNNLGGYSNATHEVTLTYRFGKNIPTVSLL